MVKPYLKWYYGILLTSLLLSLSLAIPAKFNPDFASYHRIFDSFGVDFEQKDQLFGLLTATIRSATNSYLAYKLTIAVLFAILFLIGLVQSTRQSLAEATGPTRRPYLFRCLQSLDKASPNRRAMLLISAAALGICLVTFFYLNSLVTLRSGLSGAALMLLSIWLSQWRPDRIRHIGWAVLLALVSMFSHRASILILAPYLYCFYETQFRRQPWGRTWRCYAAIGISIIVFMLVNSSERVGYHVPINPYRLIIYLIASASCLSTLQASTQLSLSGRILPIWLSANYILLYCLIYIVSWPFDSVAQETGEAFSRLSSWLSFITIPPLLSEDRATSSASALIFISINCLTFRTLFS
jgi:hypothetical protein